MRCADFGPTPGRHAQRLDQLARGPRGWERHRRFIRQNGSFMPGGSAQPGGEAAHLLLHRRLDPAHRVVERGDHQVFQHFLVVADERRIDADAADVVLAGHHHLHHARRPTGPRPRWWPAAPACLRMFSCIFCACFISPAELAFHHAAFPASTGIDRIDRPCASKRVDELLHEADRRSIARIASPLARAASRALRMRRRGAAARPRRPTICQR